MKNLKGKSAFISAIALAMSIMLNLYIISENNQLHNDLKHYETTFEAKQKHDSTYLTLPRNAFYSLSSSGSPTLDQHINELENEVYQLRPFFSSTSTHGIFSDTNTQYISILLNFEDYSKYEKLDYYLVISDSVQNNLLNSLFVSVQNYKFSNSMYNSFWSIIKDEWSTILTIIGVFGTLLMLFYTRMQISQTNKIAQASFWLEIEKMFSKFDEVHSNLRNAGKWNDKSDFNVNEWALIEDYMGLFEHCELMIQDGVIDSDRFEKIFLYRVENILANEYIFQSKLVDEKESWSLFMNLVNRYNLLN